MEGLKYLGKRYTTTSKPASMSGSHCLTKEINTENIDVSLLAYSILPSTPHRLRTGIFDSLKFVAIIPAIMSSWHEKISKKMQ